MKKILGRISLLNISKVFSRICQHSRKTLWKNTSEWLLLVFSICYSNTKLTVKKMLKCFVGINFLPTHTKNKDKHFEWHTHKNLKIVFVKSCGKIEYMLVADLVHIITHHLRSICWTLLKVYAIHLRWSHNCIETLD